MVSDLVDHIPGPKMVKALRKKLAELDLELPQVERELSRALIEQRKADRVATRLGDKYGKLSSKRNQVLSEIARYVNGR